MIRLYKWFALFGLAAGLSYESVAQDLRVTGKVTAGGSPLPGVTVQIKETTQGVSTDADGGYSINVTDPKAVLVFSFIGFVTEEVAVENRTTIDVVMTEDIMTLSEVVVIGYGTDSKKTTPSAITSVKPEDLNRGAISDVAQLLQGKVPGLNITASGDPNVKAAVILRGASTLNSSQSPLYVVDGIVGVDISIVAPDDIATIDVLKDAAATAIYGNRAANGVIIITTKRGKEGKTVVAYNTYIGIEKVSNTLDMMSADQLRAFMTKNSLALAPADDLGASTDWQDEVIRNSATSHNHNLSVSGGTDKNVYSASVNYLSKEGILPKSSLKRVITRLTMDQYALNNKLKFGFNINYSNNVASDLPFRNTILQQSAVYLPVSPVRRADGTYFENTANGNYFNPVAMVDHAKAQTKYNTLVGALTLEAKLPFGFTYNMNFSYQNESSLRGESYSSYYSNNYNGSFYFIGEPPNAHFQTNFGTNGSALRNTYQTSKKILESFLTWNKEFNEHSVTAVLGYAYQDNETNDGFQATTTNLTSDAIGFSNFALSNPYAISNYRINFGPDLLYSKTKIISDFLRVNYNYKDKYLFQGSIRRDGGSVFGVNDRWGYFPSAGVAWRAIEESFMQGQSILNDLKLRASYGVTGNALGFEPYAAQFLIGSLGTYYYNGVQASSIGPIVSPDPNLRWEKTATTNIGLDFAFLGKRVSASVDWYSKETTDMIYRYEVDPMLVPIGSVTSNGGSISNKGIEVAINASVVDGDKFRWNTTLNLAHNKNEITSLSSPYFTGTDSVRYTNPESGPGTTGHTLQIRKIGKPIGQFFTLEYAGKNENGVSQFVAADGTLTSNPRIGVDYDYMGSPQPKLLMGWANTLNYGNWSLNFFFRGVFGNKIFNVTRADLFQPATAQYTNILAEVESETSTDTKANLYSSRFIEDGSYVRLDNATLAYDFKLNSNFIRTLKLYTTVNNAFIITKYKGIDPEINQAGTAIGVDSNNFYPKTRTFLFGLNVSF